MVSTVGRSGINPLSLPKTNRVLRSSEFRQIYDTGVRITSRYFAAFCLEAAGEDDVPARFGFTVPRYLGKAVIRNRIKRRMREAVRQHLHSLPLRYSIVFNPRQSSLEVPFPELCREVGRILARCKEL